jgi:hypothetical protein
MLRVVVMVGILGLFLAGCRTTPVLQTQPVSSSNVVVAANPERQKRYDGFLTRMKWFVDTSPDMEVRSVAQFGLDKAVLGEPTGKAGTVRVINDRSITDPLIVVPIIQSDEQWSFWKEMFSKPWSATYDAEMNAIISKPQPYGDKWKNGLDLHEVFHAKERSAGLISHSPNRQEFVMAEMRAHTFHNKLLLLLGGEGYQKWLGRKIDSVISWHNSQGAGVGEIRPPEFAFDPALDTYFGKSLSRNERSSRTSVTYLAVMFGAIDETVANEVERTSLKATILHNLYKETDNGPSL